MGAWHRLKLKAHGVLVGKEIKVPPQDKEAAERAAAEP